MLSIHNMAYQGIFPKIFFSKLGLDRRLFSIHGLEYFDQVNLLKAGLIFADRVATVSPQYAREIQTSALGCGLDGVLRNRVEGVTGIINGIDYDIWDPQRDLMIQRNYSLKNVEVKAENKAFLQQALGLPVKSDAAVLGFVGRLTQQKGLDVIVAVLKELVNKNIQLIFLGVGEDKYEAQLKKVAKQFPQKIIFKQKFSEPLAHQIYAGSDIFLMPSAFEPCGLSQMISLRYGTIPIVHKTGGLADTVTDVRADKNQGNGFSFAPLDGAGFWTALDDALKYFAKKDAWGKLVERGMGQDFSWGKSAKQYVKFYETVKGR